MNIANTHFRAGLLVTLALLSAACDRTTPQEKAADDARAVAQVEAAQKRKPPVQPLVPEPVDPGARQLFHLPAGGCDFVTDPRPGAHPVLLAGGAKAVLLLNGEPAIFASDSGSPELAPGVHEKYVGRGHWAKLTRAPDTLTIRDRYERIVYQGAGVLRCASAASTNPK